MEKTELLTFEVTNLLRSGEKSMSFRIKNEEVTILKKDIFSWDSRNYYLTIPKDIADKKKLFV